MKGRKEKMKKVFQVMFVIGLLLALSTSAMALTAGTIPGGTNDNEFARLFSGPGKEMGGYFGGQLYLSGATANTIIVLDYYGAEAGYHNEFNFLGIERFDHAGGNTIPATLTPKSTLSVFNVSNGLLDFSFDYNNNAGSVVNGLNTDNTTANIPNFFLTFNPFSQAAGGATSGTSVWLFLDDGASVDDNHDDMLVRITVNSGSINTDPEPVPEPATVVLFGLGLLGLVGIRRKNK